MFEAAIRLERILFTCLPFLCSVLLYENGFAEALRSCGAFRLEVAEMKEFLPYYDEIKFAGHCACALASTFIGGAAVYYGSKIWGGRLGFDTSFCFALFAAVAIWILPFYAFVPHRYSQWIVLAVFIATRFVLARLDAKPAKISFRLWLAYGLSQAILFGIVYYNLNQ